MKIRLLTLAAGPDGVMPAGSVADVSEDLGRALIDGQFAVAVDLPAKPAPIETAMRKLPRETRKR
jgi:hypothetical protein